MTASTGLIGPGEASGSDDLPLKLQDGGLGGSISGKSQIVSGGVLVDAETQRRGRGGQTGRRSVHLPWTPRSIPRANPPFTPSEARWSSR